MTTAGRRPLDFATLDLVMPEVDTLLAGHSQVGRWSLAQICNHLSTAVVASVDGFRAKAPWLLRKTVGPMAFRRVVRTRRMPEGVRIPVAYQPRPELDARAEAESLRAALRAYAGHTGPMAPHPFFDHLDRQQYDQFHAIHCAHHLSFLHPQAAGAGA